jgi:DedD protein
LDERLKKRLIGAAVLASLAVIFVPMLVDKRSAREPEVLRLPELPPAESPRPAMFEPPLLQSEVPPPEPRPVQVPLAEPGEAEEPPADVDRPATATAPRPKPTPQPQQAISAWTVRVGSFSSRENAERLVEKLRAAGIDTMAPQPVDIQGRRLYRVQVGPEAERERAEALLPEIKELTRLDGQVRSYP